MSLEIKLPNMGDGVDNGDVLDVLVSEGDVITKEQPILELETGKATVQVPSTHAGKILKVHVKKGQSIPIGATLITLEATAGASAPAAPSKAPPAERTPAPQTPAPAKPAPAVEKPAAKETHTAHTEPHKTVAHMKPAPAAPTPVVAATPSSVPVSDDEGDDTLIAAGPAVRRFAREVGIDLRNVQGTDPGGRISRDDVLAAVRQASSQTASPPRSSGGNTSVETAPSGNNSGTPASSDAWGPVRIEKMARIRKTIAEKMHESWSTIPRVTNFDDADVTELERIRSASKADYQAKGIKLTTMPFVIKAVAMALKAHPAINASIDMEREQIIYKQYVNVGIAVDTERGLVVPSLRGADGMSISDIARSLATLAENVRNSSFSIADLQGSTFTISNLGAIGGTFSTPIINPPEVAILLIGRSRKLPIVMENDRIEARLMMPMSLSYDHRLVDGATAARFLNDVIGLLKTPSRLLLAP